MKFLQPISGRVTSKFGSRKHPITGKITFHNGVDIAAPIGTPVKAPDNGTITEIWENPKGGKCLAMINSDNIRFGFAHLHVRHVVVGQRVLKGDSIAAVGNTGASTGPHLHFTIKVKGMWVDPLLYVI